LGIDIGGRSGNRLGRPNCFTVTVKGAEGKRSPNRTTAWEWGGMSTVVKLPADGLHSFTLFLPHWAMFDSPGEYTVSVHRNLSLVPLALPAEKQEKAKPVVVTLTASAKIAVTKPDPKIYGDLIATLGVDLFILQRSERATKRLLEIRDERVIP
jgi:hypothetical protein